MSNSIYLVCPVRNASREQTLAISRYVRGLESQGHRVHWPARDTVQEDPTNGWEVCGQNARAILFADEIHVWWDPNSQGSMFDLGIVWGFRLLREANPMLWGPPQRLVLANAIEVPEGKAFEKVLARWAEKGAPMYPERNTEWPRYLATLPAVLQTMYVSHVSDCACRGCRDVRAGFGEWLEKDGARA